MKARHELDGHVYLRNQEFVVDALPTDDGAVANVDMRLNGCLWELRTINGAGESHNARLDEAVSKWERLHAANMELDSKCRVVVDNRYGTSSDESMLERIRHNIDYFESSPDWENIEEVLLISRGGDMLRVKG